MALLAKIKHILERLLGVHVYGYPFSMMQIIPEKRRHKAWFSYPSIVGTIIDKYQVDLVLDVGANIGQSGLKMRRFYKGQIISFEPVSRTFGILQNVAPHDKNWFKFNYALGSDSGERYMNVYEMDQLSSLLETNDYGKDRYGGGASGPVKELVRVRRFDEILDEMPVDVSSRKIFLKLDTQGYDLEVFRGFGEIRKNIVAVQTEVYQKPIYDKAPNWLKSIDEFSRAGFNLAGFFPVTQDNIRFLSSDCLMVR